MRSTNDKSKVELENEWWKYLLADPQTSGGLLVAVNRENCKDFETLASNHQMALTPFGYLITKQQKAVYVHD